MGKTYHAILRGDRLEWRGESRRALGDVAVSVTVEENDDALLELSKGEALADALEKLAKLDPFRDIEDPVAWQREQRRDRPLPGRELPED